MVKMPDFIHPMLPVLQDSPPNGAGWIHEIKFDGYRTQLRIENRSVRALTRRGLDWTHRFSDIPATAGRLRVRSASIDGQFVAVHDDAVTSYLDLLSALTRELSTLLVFFSFDLPCPECNPF